MTNTPYRTICWTPIWNAAQRGVGLEYLILTERLADSIWPTPFTNSFPIRREPLAVGERRQFRMAWIFAPDLTFHPQSQALTRLADRLYLFENLDGSGFRAELPVDDEGIVLDYPDLVVRVMA